MIGNLLLAFAGVLNIRNNRFPVKYQFDRLFGDRLIAVSQNNLDRCSRKHHRITGCRRKGLNRRNNLNVRLNASSNGASKACDVTNGQDLIMELNTRHVTNL